MIERAVGAGTAARWVAGDEVYGSDPKLARAVEGRGLGHAAAIASTTRVATDVVHRASAKSVAASLPRSAWEERSARAGAHGQRYHQRAWVTLHPPAGRADGCWSLLVRRTVRTGKLAYYRCYSPEPTTITRLVAVAGRRWAIEESFRAAKGLAGLDEHQVRGWTPWRR